MRAKYRMPFLVLIGAFTLASVTWLPAAEKGESPREEVAIVNGSKIMRADFDREMRVARQNFSRMGQAPSDVQLSKLKEEVLDRLITLELLYQESKKTGIKVDEAQIDEQLASLKKRFAGQQGGGFEKMLSRMNISEADVKSQMRRSMAVQKFVDAEFVQKTTVSEAELKSYYDSNTDLFKQSEQVRASHILASIDSQKGGADKAEARKKIEDVQEKLLDGEDFSKLAKEFSQCPSSGKGGDLGYFQRGQMVRPFSEAAFAMEPGEVSDIVETRFGYHIIKLTDKKPPGVMAFNDVKEKIKERLTQEKVEKEVELYIETLKKNAKVEKFLAQQG